MIKDIDNVTKDLYLKKCCCFKFSVQKKRILKRGFHKIIIVILYSFQR